MKWMKTQAAHQTDAVHQGSWIDTQACTTKPRGPHADEQYEAFPGCEQVLDWEELPIDPGRLAPIFNVAEVRQKRQAWFLLDGLDGGWSTLGGTYRTKNEARAVKQRALSEWRSLPPSIRHGCTIRAAS
jgi:hypothetical protein